MSPGPLPPFTFLDAGSRIRRPRVMNKMSFAMPGIENKCFKKKECAFVRIAIHAYLADVVTEGQFIKCHEDSGMR